jgi:hypothetical protein
LTLEQAGDPGGVALSKAVGLLHIDNDVVQLAVEVGVAIGDQLQLKVLQRGKHKAGAQGSPLGGQGKHLVGIDTGVLAEAFGDEVGLVALDSAVRVALDLKYPLGANHLAPVR